MPDITRLGTAPADRPGVLRSVTASTCPDVLLDGDRVIVIGRLLPELPDGAPGAVGDGEAVVEVPLSVFDDAARDRASDARLAASEAQRWEQREPHACSGCRFVPCETCPYLPNDQHQEQQ